MKQIIFILCDFIAFLTAANAAEYYNCVDQNGRTVLTTTPQDGMKCEIKAEDSESTLKERAQQKAEESMIKCVTEQSGGHVSQGFRSGDFEFGRTVSGIKFYRVCRDKNGKGKVVSRERL